MKIYLRDMQEKDLETYKVLNHPDKSHHEFNGPYFERETLEGLNKRIEVMRDKFRNNAPVKSQCQMVVDESDQLIGEVSWYWKSKETLWLEVGIVIFNEAYWSKGIGYEVMVQWINKVFDKHEDIVRLGLTTWSGNYGMVKLSEKLGLKQESCYKKARILNGQYYDSVSYGILREEWETYEHQRSR